MRTLLLLLLLAAATTTTLADPQCNGQGYYYSDVDECQCFSCFDGADCREEVGGCLVGDTLGNPELFEEYWRNNTGAGSQTIQEVYYRTPYQYGNSVTRANRGALRGSLLPALNDSLIQLHQQVGNIADLHKKNLVIGAGATQLIAAAIYSCKQLHAPDSQFYVYARPPYYSGYTSGLLGAGVVNISFSTAEDLDPSKVIEFVAYPNNPDNSLNKPKYPNAACIVHDQVYFWPSLVDLKAAGAPLQTTISFFSMSKLTGHAATRLGWALVDDATLAATMDSYIAMMSKHVSIDAQYRSYQVVNYLRADNLQFFPWLRSVLTTRWSQLGEIFSNQRVLVQHSAPGAFYAWIQCKTTANCIDLFTSHGINPASGVKFGGTPDFVRLELVLPDPVWELLKNRLADIVKG